MNFMEFAEYIKKEITEQLGESYTISMKEISKNNGLRLHGLVIFSEESNISPTIYLNPYYEDYNKGRSLWEIIKEILSVYEQSKKKASFDLEYFTDFSKVKHEILYKLINFEKNKEILNHIPYIRFLDLAIVFYVQIRNECIGNGSILIQNEHMDTWKVGVQTIYQVAKKNTPHLLPVKLFRMQEIIKELFAEQVTHRIRNQEEDSLGNWKQEWTDEIAESMAEEQCENSNMDDMYVLGNEEKYLGAASIIYQGVLQELSQSLDMDLYVLPSSIHEVIILPDNGTFSLAHLQDMVKEVNATHVAVHEVLSDEVYFYNRKTGQLCIA